MSDRGRWQTRANALTGLRLLSAPVLAAAIALGLAPLALLVFAAAVATDFADGWIARRYGEVSPLGGRMDHAVDACFVTAGTAALAATGALPWLLPPAIALAFAQYALDSRARGSRGLRASWLGRANGIAYYVAVAVPIARDALGLGWPPAGLVRGLGFALVATTALSMAQRGLRLLRAPD